MKLLPIVPGCKAVIINSVMGHNGKEVVVGKFLGSVSKCIGKDRWEINTYVESNLGIMINHVQESQLMRIDGNEELFKAEEIEKQMFSQMVSELEAHLLSCKGV